MKYRLQVEIINQDMEVLMTTVVMAEGANRIEAELAALKKVRKANTNINPQDIQIARPLRKKERFKKVPAQHLINFLKQQIATTRLIEHNTTKQTKLCSEHRRVAYKLALYHANKMLEYEKEII